jgi:pSer/pThr/pTyr-binding forkhead associated (FHA) protein
MAPDAPPALHAPLGDDMLARVTGELTLEIVEGPGAGTQLALDRPVVIGRAPDADLVLEDGEVSRHHARVTAAPDGSVTVEDLGSANGTFLNHNELVGPAQLDPRDELQVGVTVIQLRSPQDIAARASAVIEIPPALAMAPRSPTYVNPEVLRVESGRDSSAKGAPELEKYLDVRVRRRAQLAPLALFVLVALALIVYFALR